MDILNKSGCREEEKNDGILGKKKKKSRDFAPFLRKWLRSPWMAVHAILTPAKLPLTLIAVRFLGSAC